MSQELDDMRFALREFYRRYGRAIRLGVVALVLLWIAVGYFQTRMHLKRYAREERNNG